VLVKSRRSATLVRDVRALDDGWVSLSHTNLVRGSVLVAVDSSLGTVYQENIDYIVDHAGGRVMRIAGGTVSAGQEVTIWYEPFFLYSGGTDYTVDTIAGAIARVSGSAIADGQSVMADYQVALGQVPDAMIDRAIAEAEEAVLAMIGTEHKQRPVTGIVIGETHWAVAAVCRMQAAASLAKTGVPSSAARAASQTWLELATRYEKSGRDRLARYSVPMPTLRTGQSR
jgi:hypothetical protein